MNQIRFRFEPEKLVQALVFFSERGVRDLTKMKAAKLLFNADKYHLLKYGRPVIGDQYACMEYGPVPSAAINVMNDAIEGDPNVGEWGQAPAFRFDRRASPTGSSPFASLRAVFVPLPTSLDDPFHSSGASHASIQTPVRYHEPVSPNSFYPPS